MRAPCPTAHVHQAPAAEEAPASPREDSAADDAAQPATAAKGNDDSNEEEHNGDLYAGLDPLNDVELGSNTSSEHGNGGKANSVGGMVSEASALPPSLSFP